MISKAFKNFMSRRTMSAMARNRIMNTYANYDLVKKVRVAYEADRQESQEPHIVTYFHKVDDPYSHLTIQCIEKLKSSYAINVKSILVGEENPEAVHETSLYRNYCLEDVKRIAPFYDIFFPAKSYPSKDLIYKANSILSQVDANKFIEIASKVSFALWSNDLETIDNLCKAFPSSDSAVANKILAGNRLRNDKGYYFGSAFYYEKELYWGVDRLSYLEERLTELGLKKSFDVKPICSLRLKAPETLNSSKKVNLTYFPSLNSPYTHISTQRVQELATNSSICLLYTSPSPRD